MAESASPTDLPGSSSSGSSSPQPPPSPELPSGPQIVRDFSKYLIIENLPHDVKANEIINVLNVNRDPRVVRSRLYLDPHKRLSQTAILIYRDKEEMQKALADMQDKCIFGWKIKVTSVAERLEQMSKIEREIVQLSKELSKNCALEVQGTVCVVSSYLKKHSKVLETFKDCGYIKTVKKYKGELLLLLNFCSEAYACEIEFHGVKETAARGSEMKAQSENPEIIIYKLETTLLKLLKAKQSKRAQKKQPPN